MVLVIYGPVLILGAIRTDTTAKVVGINILRTQCCLPESSSRWRARRAFRCGRVNGCLSDLLAELRPDLCATFLAGIGL